MSELTSEPQVCLDMTYVREKDAVERLGLLRGKLWGEVQQDGTVKPGPRPVPIQVAFLDGEPALQARVREVAEEWTKHAYVKFFFGAPVERAQIRISFRADKGSWSYVGTDCLRFTDPATPTMNFGWLEPGSPEKTLRRVVLHELGHALGCFHEHQNPAGGIPWNREKVYAWYKKNKGWAPDLVERNVLRPYDSTLTVHTRVDPASIMLYPVDPALTDGKFSAGLNPTLSELDRSFIARTYPKPEA